MAACVLDDQPLAPSTSKAMAASSDGTLLPIFYPKNGGSLSSVGTYFPPCSEAAGFTETLLPIYQTIGCHVPENRGLTPPPPPERQISQV
jgi:hypothetical protein